MAIHTLHRWRNDFNLFKFYTKTWFAGWFFTLMGKKSMVLDGVDVLVPYDKADVHLRGQFQIGSYERQERGFLKAYVRPDATVLELGGCLGVVSCITNRLLKHPERHVVVEANPELIPYIERNRAHTGSRFSVENCIVSSQAEHVFYVSSAIGGSSLRRKSGKAITVPGKTVAALEKKYGLAFDTLILDIEGAELDFLRENSAWLRQVHTVIMEVHPHAENLSDQEVAECRQILLDAGLPVIETNDQIWVLQRQ
ncbi:MAG: FkbM family methyltransferase [Saprospiraceae bacterium]|nr:FkbM family methyltransferase [Saprospiraceae bacterium]